MFTDRSSHVEILENFPERDYSGQERQLYRFYSKDRFLLVDVNENCTILMSPPYPLHKETLKERRVLFEMQSVVTEKKRTVNISEILSNIPLDMRWPETEQILTLAVFTPKGVQCDST